MLRATPAFFVVAAALAVSVAALQVLIPGRCPDMCSRDIMGTFNKCIPKKSKGCTMGFCAHASGKPAVQCRLQPGVPDRVFPGETIIFKNAMVNSVHKLNLAFGQNAAKTDVYFLADATGSMNGILASVKENFLKLAAEVERLSDTAFGVGIFRDERELETGFRNIQSITKSLNTARDALSKFTPDGGLDTPEGNLAALYQLATQPKAIGWRDGARRVVLYIGDNPGHEPTCVKGVDGAITRQRVIAALNAQNVAVIALTFAKPGLDGAPTALGCGEAAKDGPRGQATAIAKASGGTVIKGFDSKFDVRAVVAAMRRLTKEVSLAWNSCKGSVNVSFTPELPTFLSSGRSVGLTVSPMNKLCSNGPYYTCEVRVKESGVLLPDLVIKFNLLKCPKKAGPAA